MTNPEQEEGFFTYFKEIAVATWPHVRHTLVSALGFSLSLWAHKKLQEPAVQSFVKKDILDHGLEEKPTSPSASVPAVRQSTLYQQFTPQRGASSWKEGPGRVWKGNILIYYRRKYTTPDRPEGYVLYDHDELLRSDHYEGPCPLLIMDRGCQECRWHNRDPHQWFDDDGRKLKCLAKVWMQEIQNDITGLEELEHFDLR